MGTARRQYPDEFKREALKLLVSSGRPLSQIAGELGIPPERLRAWRNRSGGYQAGSARRPNTQAAIPPAGVDLATENARLRRENERLRMEREILRKHCASSRNHRNEIPHHRGSARDVPEGPRILKRFLQYAETGILEERVSTSEDADSPFEETVAAVIEGLDYKVDKQVGSAGFKIDLAVRHPDQPGRYMLAVECDGATYHSALWARERDRLRQEVLKNMGWRFHRIWSTDWFYRRGAAIQKLKSALEDAQAAASAPRPPGTAGVPDPMRSRGANRPRTGLRPVRRFRTTGSPSAPRPATRSRMKWRSTTCRGSRTRSSKLRARCIRYEVARRVTSLFGKSRTGSQISAASLRSLRFLKSSFGLVEQDGFWMTPEQFEHPPVRDRSSAPVTLQRAEMLSPLEIRAAATIATQENGSLSEEEMAIAVSRLLGFKRTGSDLKVAILKALQL